MSRKSLSGGRIRRLRQERGWTQAALARRLEISASYLNLIEHGQRSLTDALRPRLAEALGVAERELSGADEQRALEELREVFADPLLVADAPDEAELRRLIATSPRSASRAM